LIKGQKNSKIASSTYFELIGYEEATDKILEEDFHARQNENRSYRMW
jgi:hypothetical protein